MLKVSDLFQSQKALVDVNGFHVRIRNGEAKVLRASGNFEGGTRIVCKGYFEAQAVQRREAAKLDRARARMEKLSTQIQATLEKARKPAAKPRTAPCIGGGRIKTDNEGNIVGVDACECKACKAHRAQMVERLKRKYEKSPTFEFMPETALRFAAPVAETKKEGPTMFFSVIGKGRGRAQARIAAGMNPLLAYLG